MARPPKRVPPDTLGGRIRAARQSQQLSLADVARDRYSTSLISQIERNRVDPSPESLQFLAERLSLPLTDLTSLVQQRRESEAEANKFKEYEDRLDIAAKDLEHDRPEEALGILRTISLVHVPGTLRWRLIALRGQCHFSLRQFVPALRDFLAAVNLQPEEIPSEQALEATTLHLHLAAASRELGQLDSADEHYHNVLGMMKYNTPIHYVAEAHWGMAMVASERANLIEHHHEAEKLKKIALHHAQNANALYRSIGDRQHSALLSCQIGLIEQNLGNLENARICLQEVLDTWAPQVADLTLENKDKEETQRIKEQANIVSAAACYLASIELIRHRHTEALAYVQQAQEAAAKSYILRRAEAYIVLGQILEDREAGDPKAEQAFRSAIDELKNTERFAAQIHAHDLLGRHLLRKGQNTEGELELDEARRLANTPPVLTSATTSPRDSL